MKLRVLMCVGACFALAGCQSEKPVAVEQRPPPKTKAEFCARGGEFLNAQFASEWQKMAVYEKMRNKGCMD
jgi:hypothetical protein